MLHCDRTERRKHRRLLEHPLGQIRVQPHALPLAGAERPALVPDRVRDPEPAKVVHQPGATERPQLRFGDAELRAGRRWRARPPRDECPRLYGDFRSTKLATASSAASNRSHESTTASAGSDSITASQVSRSSRPSKIRSPSAQISICQLGVELAVPALAGETLRRLDPASAVRDLDELRQLRDAGREWDVLALQLARPPSPVPGLVRRTERVEHLHG